ncbi:MAG: tRNA (adenosine(37)-N6)-threonylcarbamoyltransferase complex ATPase subunit type 1 TsaE [Leptospiraceae bacterium]|nr:tRNA (adenosine(37)-N6)-threonylcarbamoyltransferase complex ATPase subunit type 1 TsaE [Leptospiraceae bacterium]
MKRYSNLDEETLAQKAIELVDYCRSSGKGAVWLLQGDLGAGKTTFVRHAARALGIQETVNSPTFNLHNFYEGTTGDLNHFDLYRLNESAMMELEFSEIWEAEPLRFTVHAIEWWDRLPSLFSKCPFFRISLEATAEELRTLIVEESPAGRFPPNQQ